MAVVASNRPRVIAVSFGLFCLSLFLTAFSAKNPGLVRGAYAFVGEILRPLQVINHSAYSSVAGIWDSYVSLIGVRSENTRLQEKLNALEMENSRLLEFEHENSRLKGLLGIIEEGGFEGVAARVIGYDPSNWVQAIIVDRGSRQGIAPGMAVLEADGVVGQVVTTSLNSSRVILVADHASGVDAIVQASRARGVVEGSGRAECRLNYVQADQEVKQGDRIITSGMDGVYPKGLLIGYVSEIKDKQKGLFKHIEVKPSVVFSRLENVLIVTNTPKELVVSAPGEKAGKTR
jgi:rod shape-determining protein MreC